LIVVFCLLTLILAVSANNCFFEIKKMKGTVRANIKIESHVEIVQKQDQRTGELTEGYVAQILTKSPTHPHGIKVKLETGEVGRVKNILSPS